jgi:hypothetical protein
MHNYFIPNGSVKMAPASPTFRTGRAGAGVTEQPPKMN